MCRTHSRLILDNFILIFKNETLRFIIFRCSWDNSWPFEKFHRVDYTYFRKLRFSLFLLCRQHKYWPLVFYFQTKQIRHGSSDKCLAITESKQRLIMEECSATAARQRWSFENYDPSKLWYRALSRHQSKSLGRRFDRAGSWVPVQRYSVAKTRFGR